MAWGKELSDWINVNVNDCHHKPHAACLPCLPAINSTSPPQRISSNKASKKEARKTDLRLRWKNPKIHYSRIIFICICVTHPSGAPPPPPPPKPCGGLVFHRSRWPELGGKAVEACQIMPAKNHAKGLHHAIKSVLILPQKALPNVLALTWQARAGSRCHFNWKIIMDLDVTNYLFNLAGQSCAKILSANAF